MGIIEKKTKVVQQLQFCTLRSVCNGKTEPKKLLTR
jgi:hypothetical protein